MATEEEIKRQVDDDDRETSSFQKLGIFSFVGRYYLHLRVAGAVLAFIPAVMLFARFVHEEANRWIMPPHAGEVLIDPKITVVSTFAGLPTPVTLAGQWHVQCDVDNGSFAVQDSAGITTPVVSNIRDIPYFAKKWQRQAIVYEVILSATINPGPARAVMRLKLNNCEDRRDRDILLESDSFTVLSRSAARSLRRADQERNIVRELRDADENRPVEDIELENLIEQAR